jgi:hypothetical protein
MAARAARFTEADVKRAVAGVAKSGARDYRIELLLDGTISIVIGATAKLVGRRNTCDDLLD